MADNISQPSDKHAREKVPLARVKSASGRPNR